MNWRNLVFDQLQIFWQLYLLELLGFLLGLGLLELKHFYLSKALDRVWHAVFFQKLKFYLFLISSFSSKRHLRMVLYRRSLQEYPVNDGDPQSWIPGSHFLTLHQWPSCSYISTANKYYFSAGHHEQKNKKTTVQNKFSVVTRKQRIKLVLRLSLCKSGFTYCHLNVFKCCHCTVSSTVIPV